VYYIDVACVYTLTCTLHLQFVMYSEHHLEPKFTEEKSKAEMKLY